MGGSSCSTLPRSSPPCKNCTWRGFPCSKLVVAQYSRLEPASTGQSRRGGAPRRGVVWFSHRRLFSSKCGCYGLVGSVPCRLLSLSLSGRGGSTASLRFVMPKGRPAPPISSIFHLFGLRLAISISHATTHVKSQISHGQIIWKYRHQGKPGGEKGDRGQGGRREAVAHGRSRKTTMRDRTRMTRTEPEDFWESSSNIHS